MVALVERSSANEIAPHLRDEWNALRAMSDDDLIAAQTEAFAVTEKNLIRLAIIVRIREERGHDLSGIRIGMMRHLRRIADGKLLPEVILKYAGDPLTASRVAKLPIEGQRRCLEQNLARARSPRYGVPRSQPSGTHVELDKIRGAIVVTGVRVVITRAELMNLLDQLGGPQRDQLCSGCGETYSHDHPKRCAKCGSYSFEPVAASKVA
jgi:hypothetical protein